MKLCRIGELGKEKPAIIDKDGSYKDLSSAVSDFNSESLNFESIEFTGSWTFGLRWTGYTKCMSGNFIASSDKASQISINPLPKSPFPDIFERRSRARRLAQKRNI